MTRQIPKKTLAAIVIGNALEWYDFTVYSYMTIFIAALFFPNSDPTNSLLAATATFGAAFCMRPLGAVILGVFADRKGRKAAMTLVILLMTIALLLIACAPTYQQVGILAPIILVLARLLQGFSAGGEFGPSSALLIELSPPERHGFYGSLQMFGQMLALLMGGMVGMCLTKLLTPEELASWGWRIPFIFGLIIAPIGLYIRRHLHEEQFVVKKPIQTIRFIELLERYSVNVLLSMGLVVCGTSSFYVNLIFLPTYATHYLHFTVEEAFLAVTLGGLTAISLIPYFGALSDRVGRKVIVIIALSFYLLTVNPLFNWMVINPTLPKLILVEMIFCIFLSAYFGVFTTILAKLFPYEIRATGLSISNNVAIMLFGGFAQFIVTWLMKVTGSILAPSYYVTFGITISLITAFLLPREANK